MTELNRAGYFDVHFAPSHGAALDEDSITDGNAEFTLVGDAAQGVSLTSVEKVGEDTFRYHFTEGFTPGVVTVAFMAGTFVDSSGTTNLAEEKTLVVQGATATLVSPPAGKPSSVRALNDHGYFDVKFQPSSGSTLVSTSITDDPPEFTLVGDAAQGVSLGSVESIDANTFRYYFDGPFQAGRVEVQFIDGAFTDAAGRANVGQTQFWQLMDLGATLAEPLNGGRVDAATITGRSYIDVTFEDTFGAGLASNTIRDVDAEIVLWTQNADGDTIPLPGVSVNGAASPWRTSPTRTGIPSPVRCPPAWCWCSSKPVLADNDGNLSSAETGRSACSSRRPASRS